jgi:anthranilate/para-aminobenzoate synthase component II
VKEIAGYTILKFSREDCLEMKMWCSTRISGVCFGYQVLCNTLHQALENEPCMVVHGCNPSTKEAEAGGSRIYG